MSIRPIRSTADYSAALRRAEALMDRADQKSIDELDVLQILIEKWEVEQYAINAPTVADAIKFRMGQVGLTRRDLIPYLGTKSRVSEILGGTRQPTVDQIRALHQHLKIPAAALIGSAKHEPSVKPTNASVAAVRKLRALGVINPTEGIVPFLTKTRNVPPSVAMLRKTRSERTNAKTDLGALEAWCTAVLVKADKINISRKSKQKPRQSDARKLAQLSTRPDWHSLIKDRLSDLGIVFVVLEHLPGTYLDGAAICRRDGVPVIALTLRHDRVDNFWFTLMHEFAHVCCHLTKETPVIVDDLEVRTEDEMENEADTFARDALIPPDIWAAHASAEMGTDDVRVLAKTACVHPAIVAGRWRHENRDYRRFSKLLGSGEVRDQVKA